MQNRHQRRLLPSGIPCSNDLPSIGRNVTTMLEIRPAYLAILNQPQSKFRFRYVSELTGTHGCLTAECNDRNKKEFVRVKLTGCQEREAIIRCTLVTNSPNPLPHVHRLGGDGNPYGTEGEFQDVTVSASSNNWTATFTGLTIIHTAKKLVQEVVTKRLTHQVSQGRVLNMEEQLQLKNEAQSIATAMDMHSVRLKFQAFVTDRNGHRLPISRPVFSQPIYNQKSINTGDLRIVRINKVYGSCIGQDELFIFVEKVNKKDIKIRFFETDGSDNETWEAFADFSELDVHYQFAIAFRTPPYHDLDIQEDVVVHFQLFRPSNRSVSEAKSFTYTPKDAGERKRYKTKKEKKKYLRKLSLHESNLNPDDKDDVINRPDGDEQSSPLNLRKIIKEPPEIHEEEDEEVIPTDLSCKNSDKPSI